jgi:hypothetical protein
VARARDRIAAVLALTTIACAGARAKEVRGLDVSSAAARATQETLRDQVEDLGDPLLPDDEKLAALVALEAAGLAAVPALVARLLAPDAFFVARRRVEPGPLFSGPPLETATSVRFEVEALLYRLITPPDAWAPTPALGPGAPPRPASLQPFVEDWPAWWAEHRGDSEEALHAWSRAALAQAAPRGLMLAPGAARHPRLTVPPPRVEVAEEVRAAYRAMREVVRGVRAHERTAAEAAAELRTLGGLDPRLARHAARFRAELSSAAPPERSR